MPETGQAAGMHYLGGDYYGDPGSQRTYDTRTKTYSTNYNWLVGELKKSGQYVGDNGKLTPQQQAAQAEAQRRLGAEDFAREQTVRRGRFTQPEKTQDRTIGIEAAKQAELRSYREKVSIGQSMQATTREEAISIQRMLKSPTAQFASQQAAQRGYELASRYDRRFTPEQVRATLAPQYSPQVQQAQEQARQRFFYPAPKEQIGIRPDFPTPPRPGSIAEKARERSRLTLYRPAMRSIALSERLQKGFEQKIGYDEQSSAPKKFIAGVGSAVTSLPGVVGSGLLGYEALAKFPKKTLTQAPKSALKIGSEFVEQARVKPFETAGQITGMYFGGKALAKLPSAKIPTSQGFKSFVRSETAELYPKRRVAYAERPTVPESLKNLRVKPTEPKNIESQLSRTSTQGNLYGTFESKYEARLKAQKETVINPPEFRYGTPEFAKYLESIKKYPLIEPVETVAARWASQKLLSTPSQSKVKLLSPSIPITVSRNRVLPEKKYTPSAYRGNIAQISMSNKLKSRTKVFESTLQTKKQKGLIFPSYIQKQRQKSITTPSNILNIQSKTRQELKVSPQLKVKTSKDILTRTQLRTPTLTILSSQLKTNVRTQVQPQIPKIRAIKTITPLRERLQKEPTLPIKTRNAISRMIRKKTTKTGTRKYTTSLSGKTYKQLQKELRSIRKKRII